MLASMSGLIWTTSSNATTRHGEKAALCSQSPMWPSRVRIALQVKLDFHAVEQDGLPKLHSILPALLIQVCQGMAIREAMH